MHFCAEYFIVTIYMLTSLDPSIASVNIDDYGPNEYYASIENTSNPDWMSKLSDDKLLCDLSIPGTHDSMAVWGSFDEQPPTPNGLTLDITKLQQRFNESGPISLARQLEAGIRAIDIRVAFRDIKNEDDPIESPQLQIYHGYVYQQANLYDVIHTTFNFLKEHPKEAIFLRLKLEFGLKNESDAFPSVFKKYVENKEYGQVFYKPSVSGGGSISIPKLGDVRGKVVLVMLNGRYGGTYHKFGIDNDLIDIQDQYEFIGPNVSDQKLKHVAEQLTDTVRPVNCNKLMFNFANAITTVAVFFPGVLSNGPSALARDINQKVYTLVNNDHAIQSRIGILMFDYPGWKLIDKIISFNK